MDSDLCRSCKFHSRINGLCNIGNVQPEENYCPDKEERPLMYERASLDDVIVQLSMTSPYWEREDIVPRRLTGVLSKLYLIYANEFLAIFIWPKGLKDFRKKHLKGIKKRGGDIFIKTIKSENTGNVFLVVSNKDEEFSSLLKSMGLYCDVRSYIEKTYQTKEDEE